MKKFKTLISYLKKNQCIPKLLTRHLLIKQLLINMKLGNLFKRLLAVGLSLGMGWGMMACGGSPVDDLSDAESQVFITNYDRSVNFANYRTFSLPDSVVIVSNSGDQTSQTLLDQAVLAGLAQQLTNRGYQRVEQGSSADLGVAAIRVNNSYVGVTSSPYSSYYSNYWGYGGYGYSYYPYYPSYYNFYQVSDNYWNLQMVDLKNRNANNQQLNVIWQAEIRGNGIFDTASTNDILTNVFSQSPYLQANK